MYHEVRNHFSEIGSSKWIPRILGAFFAAGQAVEPAFF